MLPRRKNEVVIASRALVASTGPEPPSTHRGRSPIASASLALKRDYSTAFLIAVRVVFVSQAGQIESGALAL
jgi:hypothetical protein